MKTICSRLADHVNYAANRATALCGPSMLQHLKFLNGFVGEILEEATDYIVFVVTAIYIDVNLAAVAAAESNIPNVSLCWIESADRSCLGSDDREVCKCAIQKWQILNFSGSDALADFRSSGFNRRSLGCDLDRRRDFSRFHLEILRDGSA